MKHPVITIKWLTGIIFLGILVMLTACSKDKNSSKNNSSNKGRTVTFTNKVYFLKNNGDTLSTVKVAIAKTPQERDTGLMDVNNLASDGGMLFIFPKPQKLSFWMANTPLPLDIIFINKDKKIIRIHHSAQPYSDKQLNSDGLAQYVVETNGGYCIDHDIMEGMKVSFDTKILKTNK